MKSKTLTHLGMYITYTPNFNILNSEEIRTQKVKHMLWTEIAEEFTGTLLML